MIEPIEASVLRCDACDRLFGPVLLSVLALPAEALALGGEVVFGRHRCPECVERGRLFPEEDALGSPVPAGVRIADDDGDPN